MLVSEFDQSVWLHLFISEEPQVIKQAAWWAEVTTVAVLGAHKV